MAQVVRLSLVLLLLLLVASALPLASARPAASLGCDFCVEVVALAEQLANSTNVTVLVAHLDRVCYNEFHNDTVLSRACLDLAVAAGKAVAVLPDIVTHGSGYPNNVVCAMLLDACTIRCCASHNVPEQVSATFGATPESAVRVTWITLKDAPSVVQWGSNAASLTNTARGNATTTYTAGGWRGAIHMAAISPVQPGQRLFYRVGDGHTSWSGVFAFRVASDTYPLTVAVVGDMGVGNSSMGTIAALQQLLGAPHPIDWVQHVGDIAYADGNQQIWDEWGRQIQPVASAAPYVCLVGNHEIAFDFAAYRHRYPSALSPGALGVHLYWSMDRARVHFVAIDSEGSDDVPRVTASQLAWLEGDLADAAARKRAGALDWIVVSMHRPAYCSSDREQCGDFALYLRTRLEPLFQTHLVDLVMQAHAHNYERTTPVFNEQVMAPAHAPVYVVNGIGGCREGNTGHFSAPGPAWRVTGLARDPSSQGKGKLFGFAVLSIINSTALRFQVFSDDTGIFDDFTIGPRALA